MDLNKAKIMKENEALKNRINEYEGIEDQFNWQSEQDAQAIFERDQEIAQLTELLRRAGKVVENIIQAREDVRMMGVFAFQKVVREAQAVAPDLRKELEEKP